MQFLLLNILVEIIIHYLSNVCVVRLKKKTNSFIQQRCIKFIKRDRKDIYNVTKYLYLVTNCITVSTKVFSSKNCLNFDSNKNTH